MVQLFYGCYTQNVHEREAIVEGHAHEEARKGEQAESCRNGRDDAGQGADQIAQDQGRNAAETVGDEPEDDAAHDTSTEENSLGQRRVAGLVAHPVVL